MGYPFSLGVESFLLRVIPHGHNDVLRRVYATRRSGRACHEELPIPGGDFSGQPSAILQREIQILRRFDRRDGVPLDGDVARELGFQQQTFPVARHDRACQAVAIFQGDLVRGRPRSAYQQQHYTQEATTHLRSPRKTSTCIHLGLDFTRAEVKRPCRNKPGNRKREL